MWSQLKHFGVDRDDLEGDKIHRLGNLITLSVDMCGMFDRLKIWFEAAHVPRRTPVLANDCLNTSQYDADGYHLVAQAQITSFLPEERHEKLVINPNTNAEFECPNPILLNARGAICRIAHRSGAITSTERYRGVNAFDGSDAAVLANDGNSAEGLQMRLGAMSISDLIFQGPIQVAYSSLL